MAILARALPLFLLLCATVARGQSVELVRSLSGPAGKVVGSQFVLDETRNRFVFPQDRGLVVVFDWKASPGTHALTGTWKDPSGKVVFISPDIRLVSEGPTMTGYWNYEIYPTSPAGIWTLEVRIDGQPAGSHNFELVVPQAPATPAAPRLDDIYRNSQRSMVWIHKLNLEGRRVDVSSGFVSGQDRVITAFQAIDSADAIEIEFSDGRRTKTENLLGANRLQDWAILSVPTANIPALPISTATDLPMSDHYLVFSLEPGLNRTFGGVDITGRRQDQLFGERIQLAPILAAETAGGPLLNMTGQVVGLLGGNVTPGGRFDERSEPTRSPYWALTSNPGSAIPMSLVHEMPPSTFADLRAAGQLSSPIHPHPNFQSGETVPTPKKGQVVGYRMVTQFSRQDSISLVTDWRKEEKEGKGAVDVKLYDAQNRLLVTMPPKKMSLSNTKTTLQSDFSLPNAPRGTYRIDVRWNEETVWRTFITITD